MPDDLPDWERLLAAERHLQTLSASRALYNRTHLELRSDEVLAQILDRGSLDDWRALYALAARDPDLRRRIARVIERAPVALPRMWRVALASLGETVDWSASVARHEDSGT